MLQETDKTAWQIWSTTNKTDPQKKNSHKNADGLKHFDSTNLTISFDMDQEQ